MPKQLSQQELQLINDVVQPEEAMRFIEVVETELMSLHEGNIARYKLRPHEYRHWKENWI